MAAVRDELPKLQVLRDRRIVSAGDIAAIHTLLGEADLSMLNRVSPADAARSVTDSALDGDNGNGNGRKAVGDLPEGALTSPSVVTTKAATMQNLAVARRLLFKLKCPECQTTLVFAEGCVKCTSCGYSQC